MNGFVLIVSCRVGWQLVLVFTAQTTIEFYQNRERARYAKEIGKSYHNPFDLGIDRNFQHFFGTMSGQYWFSYLLPGGAKPVGDGVKWITRFDSAV